MAFEIEEKQFEQAANLEIARNQPHLFTPGQVLEGMLGFDAAAAPSAGSYVWEILQAGVPSGIVLQPTFWTGRKQPPDQSLPTYAVSLVLQYKRSEFCDSARSKQWPHWRRSYYRFQVRQPQHSTLMTLEACASNLALVRYAGPAFYTYRALEQHLLQESILANSSFVSPTSLGPTHEIWSFLDGGTHGWANPDGEEFGVESWDNVLKKVGEIGPPQHLYEHLNQLVERLTRVHLCPKLEPPAFLKIAKKDITSAKAIRAIFNLSLVAQAVNLAGASWWVLLTEEKVPAGRQDECLPMRALELRQNDVRHRR